MPGLAERGLQIDECKTATQRQIDQSERAVGDIHGADDIEIVWDENTLAI